MNMPTLQPVFRFQPHLRFGVHKALQPQSMLNKPVLNLSGHPGLQAALQEDTARVLKSGKPAEYHHYGPLGKVALAIAPNPDKLTISLSLPDMGFSLQLTADPKQPGVYSVEPANPALEQCKTPVCPGMPQWLARAEQRISDNAPSIIIPKTALPLLEAIRNMTRSLYREAASKGLKPDLGGFRIDDTENGISYILKCLPGLDPEDNRLLISVISPDRTSETTIHWVPRVNLITGEPAIFSRARHPVTRAIIYKEVDQTLIRCLEVAQTKNQIFYPETDTEPMDFKAFLTSNR
jgi:hypothetical protein